MTFHEDDIMEHNFTPKERDDVVVDIGAHIGPYTIIAFKTGWFKWKGNCY